MQLISEVLRPSRFITALRLIALRIPTQKMEASIKALRDLLVTVPKIRPAVKPSDNIPPSSLPVDVKSSSVVDERLLLLHQSIRLTDLSDAPSQEARARILNVLSALPGGAEGRVIEHVIQLGYEHLGMDEVLRIVLPPDVVDANQGMLPSGFEIVGHIAHINIKDELLDWRYVIGKVLLDKNPALRTVVNKSGVIETTFRTFPMEVVAGDDDTKVELRNDGVIFEFDFRDVYWNSRLQHEHEGMVSRIIPRLPGYAPLMSATAQRNQHNLQQGEKLKSKASSLSSSDSFTVSAPNPALPPPSIIVADAFCGVGPFVLPLALKRLDVVHILANDLNPHCYKSLVHNLKRNKVQCGRVSTFNLDARDFVRIFAAKRVQVHHVLMNLPNDAIEFCDVFVGFFTRADGEDQRESLLNLGSGISIPPPPPPPPPPITTTVDPAAARACPTLHVYCFSKSETEVKAADDVVRRLLNVLKINPVDEAELVDGEDIPSLDDCEHSVVTPLVRHVRRSNGGSLPGLLIRCIRNVAPGKLNLCASFTLPMSVALAAPVVTGPLSSELVDVDKSEKELETEPSRSKKARVE
jgi:tRNA (guanine37-N1)-methyltransferase